VVLLKRTRVGALFENNNQILEKQKQQKKKRDCENHYVTELRKKKKITSPIRLVSGLFHSTSPQQPRQTASPFFTPLFFPREDDQASFSILLPLCQSCTTTALSLASDCSSTGREDGRKKKKTDAVGCQSKKRPEVTHTQTQKGSCVGPPKNKKNVRVGLATFLCAVQQQKNFFFQKKTKTKK
jgi:hypothetical protein